MASPEDYDRQASGYRRMRQPDPRIASAIDTALGDARSVLNVGAGTGSYEPQGRAVTAVEPSAGMIAARPSDAAPVVQATAESLPFGDRSFDASMAILTVHHWQDQAAGLREMARVARRRVVLTWDPDYAEAFWLSADYLPAFAERNRAIFSPISVVTAALGNARIETVRIAADCTDGFLCAYWRRPEAFLDDEVREAISTFQEVPWRSVQDGLRRLEDDLASGAFWTRYAELRSLTSLDLGYRLVISEEPRVTATT